MKPYKNNPPSLPPASPVHLGSCHRVNNMIWVMLQDDHPESRLSSCTHQQACSNHWSSETTASRGHATPPIGSAGQPKLQIGGVTCPQPAVVTELPCFVAPGPSGDHSQPWPRNAPKLKAQRHPRPKMRPSGNLPPHPGPKGTNRNTHGNTTWGALPGVRCT